mmetsp:Transcript_41863/g.119457  ORF Transcript_41863/g.119457 Transcript_41863/m.119457 type:complete len:202 (+) Transcript_41863:324-929(+)
MSLEMTFGTSWGTFIRKLTLLTRVPGIFLLLAQGHAESSKALRFRPRSRGRQSSSSRTAAIRDRAAGRRSVRRGSSAVGASAAGSPAAVAAKESEIASDHLRVIFLLKFMVFFRSCRMEAEPLVVVRLRLPSAGWGVPPPADSSRASGVTGGIVIPLSSSGMSQGSCLGDMVDFGPLARSFQNSRSHSASAWMLSCSCRLS